MREALAGMHCSQIVAIDRSGKARPVQNPRLLGRRRLLFPSVSIAPIVRTVVLYLPSKDIAH